MQKQKLKKLYKINLNGKIIYKYAYTINQLDFLLKKEYPGIQLYDYNWNIEKIQKK